jgi:hypothetical protein
VHLSELSAAPELKEAGLEPQKRLERIAALGQAVSKLRQGLREVGTPAILIVTSDRVAVFGTMGDSGQGYFLDPAFTRVPFVTERFSMPEGWLAPRRPDTLVGVKDYLESAASLPTARASAPASSTEVRPIGVSTVPWFWCRWSPAVSAAVGSDLWIFDGTWRKAGAGAAATDVAESEVPQPVRDYVTAEVAKLAVVPPRGPKMQEAVAIAREASFEIGADDLRAATPSLEARRNLVEELQRARAAMVQNRPVMANRAFRRLAEHQPPMLAG